MKELTLSNAYSLNRKHFHMFPLTLMGGYEIDLTLTTI